MLPFSLAKIVEFHWRDVLDFNGVCHWCVAVRGWRSSPSPQRGPPGSEGGSSPHPCRSWASGWLALIDRFAAARKHLIGYEHIQPAPEIREPAPAKDKVCPGCNRRLTFLRFVARVLERAA